MAVIKDKFQFALFSLSSLSLSLSWCFLSVTIFIFVWAACSFYFLGLGTLLWVSGWGAGSLPGQLFSVCIPWCLFYMYYWLLIESLQNSPLLLCIGLNVHVYMLVLVDRNLVLWKLRSHFELITKLILPSYSNRIGI